MSDTGTDRQRQDNPKEITIKELLEAMMENDKQINRRFFELEQRIAKYDRIFESIFRQEAEQRLGTKQDYAADQWSAISPLDKLKHR